MEKQHSWKNFRKVLTSTAVLGLLAVLLTVSGSAQPAETTNDLNVSVNISESTIIDIQPSSFAWGMGGTELNPGSFAGTDEEVNGYGRIQIENLGSVNISQVWFNTTAPTERPFGTANSDLYDSANFIMLSSNDSSAGPLRDQNTFVGRTEYGIDSSSSQDIIYLERDSTWDFGRFRNGSYEYFWALDDESVASGAEAGTLRIGINHHNSTQTGSTNLDEACTGGDETGSADCNGYTLSSNNGYTYTEVEVGAEDTSTPGPDGGVVYCAVMDTAQVQGTNNPRINFVKWNAGHPGVQAAGTDCGTVTQYMINGTELAPGAWETMNIRANIPYGVVSGTLPTGQLTVLANSN